MIQISGCVNTQKIHLLSGIGSGCGYKLVVFSNEEKAKKAYEGVFTVWRRDVFVSCKRFAFFIMRILKGRHLQIEEWKC